MNAIPAHILEATRLVRQGRIAEATALLRRGGMDGQPGCSVVTMPLRLRSPRLRLLDAPPKPAPPRPQEGGRFEDHAYSGPAGARPYKLFVPGNYDGEPAPLIVMLHGCTQSPEDFAAGTRMNVHAEANGFLVAYPAQSQAANGSRCWNWFNASEQRRGRGEPAIIVGIVRDIANSFLIDPERVFVAGLSAGGAAAANLAFLYPDVFAAVGVHSGLACGAAVDMSSAFGAMQRGGSALANVKPGSPSVPTIVFHGASDQTVNAVNGEQVVLQAAGKTATTEKTAHGISQGGRRFTVRTQVDRAGRVLSEHWLVHGGGHAWFGGSSTGSYTDPNAPDASAEMVRFFLQR